VLLQRPRFKLLDPCGQLVVFLVERVDLFYRFGKIAPDSAFIPVEGIYHRGGMERGHLQVRALVAIGAFIAYGGFFIASHSP
jgi:hypothetical protein